MHEVSLESSTGSGFENGIVITYNQYKKDCHSHIGVCPGCGWPAQYGAPSTWQILNLSRGCWGTDKLSNAFYDGAASTKHEMLHALGFFPEQSRQGILRPYQRRSVVVHDALSLSKT